MPPVKRPAPIATHGSAVQGSDTQVRREPKSFVLMNVIEAEQSREWPHWIDEWRVVKAGGNYQEELERRFMGRWRPRNLNPGKRVGD